VHPIQAIPGDDFRDVRAVEFGPLERRTIGHDFRRGGAVEAISGGAKAEQLAHAMANTLSASNALRDLRAGESSDVALCVGSAATWTAKTALKGCSRSPSIDDPQQMACQNYLLLGLARISQLYRSVRVRVFV